MENNWSLIEAHQKRTEWSNKLDFYQDELLILQKELYKTVDAHPDLPSIIEHFNEYRSIIKKKLDKIDELRFSLLLAEKQLNREMLDQPGASLGAQYDDFLQFEINIEAFKNQIRRFIAKNMK
ncbi:MAG: hypothetical protein IPN73_12660 [Saprospiraceae bacterium]|nr:hypothetical protein [Saprospiraceae bacterium]MBK8850994.1 hypothetical protein [Saprospiraceae bacterium]MBK9689397.1 hypothetical protein [Saprospiraceae bacterium]